MSRLQGRCSLLQTDFFFNLLVFSLPPFKCFLPWFRADISCVWCCGGRGSVSLLPSLPRCCSDTVTPPQLLTVEAAAPIPPSLQNRCRARSLIWAGDVISHLLFKFLPHLKPHQGAGGEKRAFTNSHLRSGPAALLSCWRWAAFYWRLFNSCSAISAIEPGLYFTIPAGFCFT